MPLSSVCGDEVADLNQSNPPLRFESAVAADALPAQSKIARTE